MKAGRARQTKGHSPKVALAGKDRNSKPPFLVSKARSILLSETGSNDDNRRNTARKEWQTFDCKSTQIDPKALAIPIVAMVNADGGVLPIGVSDKTRRVEGAEGNEKRLNELLRVPSVLQQVRRTIGYLETQVSILSFLGEA